MGRRASPRPWPGQNLSNFQSFHIFYPWLAGYFPPQIIALQLTDSTLRVPKVSLSSPGILKLVLTTNVFFSPVQVIVHM